MTHEDGDGAWRAVSHGLVSCTMVTEALVTRPVTHGLVSCTMVTEALMTRTVTHGLVSCTVVTEALMTHEDDDGAWRGVSHGLVE